MPRSPYSDSRSRSRSPRRGGGGGGGGGGGDGGGGNRGRNEDAKLYVGGLSFNTRWEDLQREFEKYGKVTDCFLPKDYDTGKGRGFGFITFESVRDAEDAEDGMDGKEFEGRVIRVNKPQQDRPDPSKFRNGGGSSRGGGGGGGYRGGGRGGDRGRYDRDDDRGGYGGYGGGGGGGGGALQTEKSQWERDYRELHGVAPPRGKPIRYDRVTGDRLPD